jgi:hypothetical protein
VIAAAAALCGSHTFQHNFSSSSHLGVHHVRNTWFYSNLMTGILYSSTIIKSLISIEYNKVFRCPRSQKPRGLKSGDHAGQLTEPPHLNHWFACCLTVWRKWGCAPSCMNHTCWRGNTCSKSTGKSFIKKLFYTAPVSLLGKATGHKSCPPRLWCTHISAGSAFWTYIDWHFFSYLRTIHP